MAVQIWVLPARVRPQTGLAKVLALRGQAG
jgi:hypothetical protein